MIVDRLGWFWFQLPGAVFFVFFDGEGEDSLGGLFALLMASSKCLLYVPTNSGRS